MSADEITHIIQSILAPVVMITACAITVGGLMTHYGAVNERLRTMTRERLDLLRETHDADQFRRERLSEIDHQVPELVRRHRIVRNAIMAIYASMVSFVVCMFAIAIAAIGGWSAAPAAVLVSFMVGMVALLVGLFLSAVEIRVSHRALDYEVQRVLGVKAGFTRPSADRPE